jgi:hypothetical protein
LDKKKSQFYCHCNAAEWEKFIVEEQLYDFDQSVNQTAVAGHRHYFINFGNKTRLIHHPIDQFKGEAA